MTTWKLSGFGDEIDPDPVVQAAVLRALGARHIEVRSAWGTNIVELDDDQLLRLRGVFDAAEIGVSAIASPIGKVQIGHPIEGELRRLDRAIAAARVLDARYIRIFSFYRPDGVGAAEIREPVLAAMSALVERADAAGVVLLHENEKDIYGDVPSRVLDLVESIGSPTLRLAWDNANYVQVGVRPVTDGLDSLLPYVDYLQVKDARMSDGTVVAAGDGDGELRETIAALRDSGYSGFSSLEPHLSVAGEFGGWSGPERFGVAARSFRALTDQMGIELA